jgi:hypothetical protein
VSWAVRRWMLQAVEEGETGLRVVSMYIVFTRSKIPELSKQSRPHELSPTVLEVDR